MSVSDLPALNACLNSIAIVLLTAGFFAIKTHRKRLHAWCMASAFVVSAIFLCTYVLHKYLVGGVHTPFGGEGFLRTAYLVMLASHIILAMVILPLILVTFSKAVRRDFPAHRRWARVTFPIWYYVSITGVLVYLMLYQWFPAT
ncbi:MAG: DUF420 domain-containing protein [Chthoniobacterales bacterium]